MFLGHSDGSLSAHDAKTLQEVWSFNIGTGINAPPISFAVNGKQYIAVLVGSRQSTFVTGLSPELKNTATASMLYVFEQQATAATDKFAGASCAGVFRPMKMEPDIRGSE